MAIPRLRATANDHERMVHPNQIVYNKMEHVVRQMLDPEIGVPIKTVKSFLSKVPSVFTGADLISWLIKYTAEKEGDTKKWLDKDKEEKEIAEQDALHIAHLIASHGYLFQIDDHVLTVKNDGTFYRFQTPYFWPSNCWEPENTDYAVYLCKRTMQNKAHLELEDFEAENLAKLQKMFSRKWEFVFMQAEAQYKVDKKRDRLERQILDSQERAFWDVHRPVPGCVNTTEVDFRKLSRSGRPKYQHQTLNATASGSCSPYSTSAAAAHAAMSQPSTSNGGPSTSSAQPTTSTSSSSSGSFRNNYPHKPGLRRCTQVQDTLKQEIQQLNSRLAKNVLKTSKVIENYIGFYEHRRLFDPHIVILGSQQDPFQSHTNPWTYDNVDLWTHDKITGDISTRRLQLWEDSFEELLSDNIGRDTLQKFLDKEYSGENLRFWWEVQKLRKCSCRMVPVLVTEIYNEFIDTNATSPVNVDCKVMEITEENLKNPNRWSFDEAADHIFCLMKNDSYQRFLRSDIYKDLLAQSRKKTTFSMSLIGRKASRKVSRQHGHKSPSSLSPVALPGNASAPCLLAAPLFRQ
ncbi:hypothetical protein PMAYCL1PPCAC_30190 [Pristionchus mayeri]|uniref:Egl-10 n=1 Tax=Pristionchus mayeri TaxID=1317129 RepID=A0AAN5DD81_9BILA|nr:hypothetical protein PMAYCL1PPCAC_30190 [Pristionchus mayeri]